MSKLDFEGLPLFSEAFKKLKRLRLFEPFYGVLGFFFITVCVVFCFFYLDSRAFSKGFRFSGQSERFVWLQTKAAGSGSGSGSGSGYENPRVEFLGENGRFCNVFDGDWVWDESYPLYQSKDCRFLDDGFRCSENGRPDLFYTKWRWQPRNCNLPRFDAKLMLERLRGKRLVFVGDSIGRNQWESLLCLLSSAEPDKDSIYEVNGSPITKHKGFLIFKFKNFNCTIEYYRAPFLVPQSRPPSGSPGKIKTTLKLDQMDWTSSQWRNADVLVFNTGHWWNNGKTIRMGCYFQEGRTVKMEMKVEDAYQRSIETVVRWIEKNINPNKTQVFFRTYAPVHFRGGDWKTGGSCHLETLPELGSSLVPSDNWEQFQLVNSVLSAHSHTLEAMNFQLLNVTWMTGRRKDGHLSLYYLGPNLGPVSPHRQDCSHWCLPGVPDTWNELLYALFLKHETTRSWKSSTTALSSHSSTTALSSNSSTLSV